MEHFGDRLAAAVAAKGPICVGLDPRLERIPPAVRAEAERETTPEARARVTIARFHRVVIDAVADRVPVVKLQLAFYEQYGIPGLLAYQDTVAAAREAGMLVIADAKRNDVPSTAEAYARAFLQPGSERPDGLPPAFEADALTVNPYLGRDSLMPFVDRAATAGKGLFVLVKTSNPGSGRCTWRSPTWSPTSAARWSAPAATRRSPRSSAAPTPSRRPRSAPGCPMPSCWRWATARRPATRSERPTASSRVAGVRS
jgi:orotidine 5'-phosphate decarboxylase subfamily 2